MVASSTTSFTVTVNLIPTQFRQNPYIFGNQWWKWHDRTLSHYAIINLPSFPNLQLDKSIIKITSRFETASLFTGTSQADLVTVNHLDPKNGLVLSETDLNKSSTSKHDYDRQPTLSGHRSDLCGALQCRSRTSTSIVLGSWLDQRTLLWSNTHFMTLTQSHWTSSKVTQHAKLYTTTIDHTRAPNNLTWNTAPHRETANQQACLSVQHITVSSVHRHSWREKL